jgi:hypothetical protein
MLSRIARKGVQLTTKEKGDALEQRVALLLTKDGKWAVRHNVQLRDSHGNLSQVDVCYGLFYRRYIECKNYAPSRPVGLEEVSKFKAVLELNGISASRGMVVTTGRFSPRCSTIGLKCVDGAQLNLWEERVRQRWIRRAFRICAMLIVACAMIEHTPALITFLCFVEAKRWSITSWVDYRGTEAVLRRVHAVWVAWKATWTS